jgi:hypothetical protein
MKYLPATLAGLAAMLIAACIFEYGARGLNPPVDSDWVVSPAWWQSDYLADCGLYFRWLAVSVFEPALDKLVSGGSDGAFRILFWSQFIFAGIGYAIVFCVAKILMHAARLLQKAPNPAPEPTAPSGRGSS